MVDLSNAIAHNLPKSRKIDSRIFLKVNYLLLVLIVFFGCMYLFTINSLGTQGYEIKQLETRIKQLDSRHKYLELQSSNLQSISKIQEQIAAGRYVPVAGASYMKDSDFALR